MSTLDVKVTDIDGVELGLITRFKNLEVRAPFGETRSGRLTISMFDRNAEHILPLKRMIKVYNDGGLVLWGHILRPRFDFEAATIDIDVHDPTAKLKHHYHRFGDVVVDEGYPLDGRGIRRLIESSIPMDSQLDRGVKPNGIMWGVDTTTPQLSKPVGERDPATEGIWGLVHRGENVWQSIQKAMNAAVGPDVEFIPTEGLDPGYFVVMNTGAKPNDPDGGDPLGVDRSETVKFMYPINAKNFIWEPDGNAVRNYWVAVNPGGEKDAADNDNKALYHDEASWLEYGIMQGWESVGSKVPKEVLTEVAKGFVKAYAQPPNYFTVVPKTDAPNVPRWPADFEVGDFITAHGQRGGIEKTIKGRVVNVTLKQTLEGSRKGHIEIDCTPALDGTPVAGEEDDS
jgi:hypothetical protein